MTTAIAIILYIILAYLGIFSIYLLIFAIAGALWNNKKFPGAAPKTRFTVFFPCYKNDEVALASIETALRQQYPKELFDVVLIADRFQPESVEKARQLGAHVVEVFFESSTKAKALNKAIEQFPPSGQYYMVLDVDNVMADNALQLFDHAITHGAVAIQGHRTAKNLDTPYAVLDAVSEEINNTIFRKGQQAFGLTSAIIGSGMAVEGELFADLMRKLTAVGGFDKELEMHFIARGITVLYLNDALVYDEKVQQKDIMETQRRRWISAQWTYFVKYFPGSFKGLLTGQFQLFFKTIQLAILPRVLHLAVTGFLAVLLCLQFAVFHTFPTAAKISVALLLITALAMLVAIPRKLYNRNTLFAILALPGVMWSFFTILFKLKGANKTFIHTPHQTVKK